MKLLFVSIFVFLTLSIATAFIYIDQKYFTEPRFSDMEVGFEDMSLSDLSESIEAGATSEDLEEEIDFSLLSRGERWAYFWKEFSALEKIKYGSKKNTSGVLRVGIQSGHWKNSEVPEELDGLKRNGSGAVGGGKVEATIVLEIANKVKTLLEKEGIVVDLLPATIPEDYFADAFVSIHADGNKSSSVSGFKIASPQRDFSGKSVLLENILYETYENSTNLDVDRNITRRMSGYYAFNWRRYIHALHPMTPAVIVETGFITSPEDRKIIVSSQDMAAKGIADGIVEFLRS
ncbi:MAG TPA: N-acetylmuramoyl-L-alanine amidase [Candidatus Paceibacterota bacterium]